MLAHHPGVGYTRLGGPVNAWVLPIQGNESESAKSPRRGMGRRSRIDLPRNASVIGYGDAFGAAEFDLGPRDSDPDCCASFVGPSE